LRTLFAQYDEVIIDSAPVLAGSSAVILSTLVDEVIMVLRAGRSRMDETRAAQEHLASVGGRVVGVILNGVDERTARYSYSYSYAHASRPTGGDT
jgi:Mrp family chromosome partitioning ATPase